MRRQAGGAVDEVLIRITALGGTGEHDGTSMEPNRNTTDDSTKIEHKTGNKLK